MPEPRNPDEYLKLVDEAIFEIGELMRCAEDEDDSVVEFGRLVPIYQQMMRDLSALRAEVAGGTHAYGGTEDLPFMSAVKQNRALIPIGPLLEMVNRCHKAGFPVSR
jgi:hypothetical protein